MGWKKLNPKKIYFTLEGGIAIKLINKIGGISTPGYIVEPGGSIDNSIQYTINNDINPIGIIYNAVQDGDFVWVVIAGIAKVFYGTAVARGTFSRVAVVADGVSPGQAINEPLPTPPFATDKHFQEIGHPLESRATPGLAKTILHFN